MKLLLFFILQTLFWADVPRVITYQGRLLDEVTAQPVAGTGKRNFRVILRRASDSPTATPLLVTDVENVLVQDGLFTLHIDLSQGAGATLSFDEIYSIDILAGPRSTGGRVGNQTFVSVPYAFAAQNTLLLGGKSAAEYALATHSHDSLNVASFTIDGSRELKGNLDQLVIKNKIDGTEKKVLRITEDGALYSTGKMTASSSIIVKGGIQVRKTGNTLVGILDNSGDMTVINTPPGTMSVAGQIRATGSMLAMGTSTYVFKDLSADGFLAMLRNSQITGNNIHTLIGSTHTLEEHNREESSNFFSSLTTMTSGQNADSLHKHSFTSQEIKGLPDNIVEGKNVLNESITGEKLSENANLTDSRLATLVTSGKIALSALPPEVANRTLSNVFTNAFPTLVTQMDRLRSKSVSVVSTFDDRVIGAFTLVRFADRPTSLTNPTNPGNRFQYDLMSSGDVVYSRPSEPVTSFGLVSPDPKSKTFLQGTNLEFQNPQLASGVDFFNGSMIKSASISNADFANDTISSTELADASLQTADFADLSVLAENIAPLTTSAFASASVSASKIKTNISPLLAADFADGAVTNAKFAVAGIGQTVFADRSIARTAIATKTLLGNRFVNASVAGLVQLSSADFQIGSIQVTKLSSSVANLLNKDKFALSAFQARTQPVDVITSLAPVVALTQTQSLFSAYQGKDFPVFMRLTVPGFVSGSSASAAVELLDSNSNRVFSIHNNGNLHLGFAESATLVTSVPISAKALANMVGVPTKTGDCGSGDINMTTLNIGFSTSGLQSADCISKTINHGLSQLSWHPAEQICLSNGYRLCSVQQYYNACRVGGRIASTKTYITGKLASPTKAITFSVNNTNSCTGTADFTVGSANLTGGPFDFHCCQK